MITINKGICYVKGDPSEITMDIVAMFKTFNEYKEESPFIANALFSALWVSPEGLEETPNEETKKFLDNVMKGFETFKDTLK